MNATSEAQTGTLDPIETVLAFVLKYWLLLIVLPVAAAIVAFLLTMNPPPREFTATLRIPAPPFPLEAFDNLTKERGVPLPADGSIIITALDPSPKPDTAEMERVLAAAQKVAVEAAGALAQRLAVFRALEAKLAAVEGDSGTQLNQRASAMASVYASATAAETRARVVDRWATEVLRKTVILSPAPIQTRPWTTFAFFGGLTAAVLIAIARDLWSRRSARASKA